MNERHELLINVLLSCRWTSDDHRLLGIVYKKERPLGTERLLSALHQQFPGCPARKHLALFFAARRSLLKGLRWSRLERTAEKVRLRPAVMQPAVQGCEEFEVPAIASKGDLAKLCGLPIHVIDWLSRDTNRHYVITAIEKRSSQARGAYRILEQPKHWLKRVQRDLLREVLQFVPPHPAAHGFVRGRSVLTHAQPHVGHAAVLRMDLESFFPSIHAARVSALFRSLGYPLRVTDILTNLCTTSLSLDAIERLGIPRRCELLSAVSRYHRPHLPQGAPTSPALANLVAYRLDARLTGLAKKAGINYSRFADDLLFSGDRHWRRNAHSFAIQVAVIAAEEGFQVQHRKTRLMPRSVRQSATGIVLNELPNVDRQSYDRLKATLTNCIRSGPASQNRQQLKDFRSHLLGRIAWINQVHPVRGRKLLDLFEKITW